MRDEATLFRVAPTFPVDDRKVREFRRARVFGSPVTWGAFAAAIGIGVLAGAEVLGFAGLLVAAACGVRYYWLRRWADLEAECLQAVIRASNREQDAELSRIIGLLDDRHHPHYAVCLGRFLLVKQKIEAALHSREHLQVFAPEIEKLVDGICAEVCREITELIERQESLGEALTSRDREQLEELEKARMDSHASILHAYTTLFQAHSELGDLGRVGELTGAEELKISAKDKAELDEMIEELQHEAESVARTNRRLRGESAPASETVTAVPVLVTE